MTETMRSLGFDVTYCGLWRTAGFVGWLAVMFLAFAGGALVARLPRNWMLGALFGAVSSAVLVGTTQVAVLIGWNGIRPAICDRID